MFDFNKFTETYIKLKVNFRFVVCTLYWDLFSPFSSPKCAANPTFWQISTFWSKVSTSLPIKHQAGKQTEAQLEVSDVQ